MTGAKLKTALPAQLCVFDTETSGIDVENDRIVTAFVGIMDTATGVIVESWSWLLDPKVEIPKGASDVHGITTERARAEGTDAAKGVFEIMQRLDIISRRGIPLVAMNAAFDFTLLDREVERHWPGTRPLLEGDWQLKNEAGIWEKVEPGTQHAMWRVLKPVIFDPMIFDRAVDKYRAGSRRLVDLAAHYGVPVEANAHDAEADCRMVGRIAIKLLQHSRLSELTMSEVHAQLIPTARNNALGLADFWEGKKIPRLRKQSQQTADLGEAEDLRRQIAELSAAVVEVRTNGIYWPIRPRPEQRGVTA